MAGKTAREKLAAKKQIKKVVLEKSWGGIKAGDTMLVATPLMVDAYVRDIPHGETKTIPDMRHDLAAREACSGTCPMSTSIFVRMVAEAALEALEDGKPVSEVSPFWRLVTGDDKITKRLNVDPAWVDEQRALEARST
ncbi:MAG: hypothetical protein NXH72_00130 [Hyphomonadaceae bacterium]|nr:hypothetical protein [Hyphomonadaceae bacterium]